MLHIIAICHITVDMSNQGKICPYKMKKMFRQTTPHIIPQLDKTLGQTGQILRACTVGRAFYGINNFSLVVLKKTSEKVAGPL